MDAIEMIKERRSVRKFKDEVVDRELMTKIIDIARWAPSWGNLQVARYTVVDTPEIIKLISEKGVNGFIYNSDILRSAKGVIVLSVVKGKSGKLGKENYETDKAGSWELFDAGIACQTFCLAAFAEGIGTVILGVINDEEIAKAVRLPEEESVAALIVYGYQDGNVTTTARKHVNEIMRFAK
jgi:nitroreductase